MGRPTIALCCILKNEIENLPKFMESIEGCFDEIHLVDTGSTDGSLEFLTQAHRKTPHLFLHTFTWIDDFAAARNFSFEQATTDYIMWLDLDDVLSEKKAFQAWRDTVMPLAEYWLATYHYTSDSTGKPTCSFARERVIKNRLGMQWKYFVHEGIMPAEGKRPVQSNYAASWSVVHQRTENDLKKDRSRNLNLFASRLTTLDARMTYYYGKELFENQQPKEAIDQLLKAAASPELEMHDRILSLQYAALAFFHLQDLEKAIALSFQGLQLAPLRAEFYVLIGDSYTKQHRLAEAVPFYQAALHCQKPSGIHAAPIFVHEDSYGHYPYQQLSRLYVNLGLLEKATEAISAAETLGAHPQNAPLRTEIEKLKKVAVVPKKGTVKKISEIVFLAPPTGLYEWDEEIATIKGVGGSETACIAMAKALKALRPSLGVKIFNERTTGKVINGVEYLPSSLANAYFAEHEPLACINWRHCMRLTQAPTYIWLHDLMAPGLEKGDYEAALVLSPFHANYINQLFNVPREKIITTRNGIDPTRFQHLPFPAKELRVVFSSSPDRGLDRALLVMDEVVRQVPTATFHCYYGFENMIKCGHHEEAKRLKGMLSERPYAKYHGNLDQAALATELEKSSVWLYPTNFLETFCITALEMLSAGVYPVVRRWGALPDTLFDFPGAVLDSDCQSEAEIALYAKYVVEALQKEKWETVNLDPQQFSWERVAESWLEWLPLSFSSP